MTTTEITGVESYLRATINLFADHRLSKPDGYEYLSREDFVLRHGVTFPEKRKPKGALFGKLGNCYGNCTDFVINEERYGDEPDRYRYVEGYAQSDFFPMEHAWVLDTADDHIFDLTWRPWYRKRNDDGSRHMRGPSEYLGVVIPTSVLIDTVMEKQTYGVLDHMPIYKRPWPYGAEAQR